MAAKLTILALLIFSMFFIFQVLPDSNKNEESSHLSQVLIRGERKLMNNMVFGIPKYLKERLVSRALVPAPAPSPVPTLIDCDGLCRNRCRLQSRKNMCTRACGTCCVRCNCVPAGTYGNREMCGTCYTGMTTHGNKTKCP